MSYQVHLSAFEGPLDLLLTLIQSKKLAVTEVAISKITKQYLQTVAAMDVDMESASEFLAMAATLILIKSRALLPGPPVEKEGELSPEQALVLQLQEYRRFKEVTGALQALEEAGQGRYCKLPEEAFPGMAPDALVADTGRLAAAFARSLRRGRRELPTAEEVREIRREKVSVGRCMQSLRRLLRREGAVDFDDLFTPQHSKLQCIGMFLALLELIHKKEIVAVQRRNFAAIRILPAPTDDARDDARDADEAHTEGENADG